MVKTKLIGFYTTKTLQSIYNINTNPRNGVEKFIRIGWFQFLMNANIEADSIVRLTLLDPPENLIIAIIDP
jgi:hypothetical protein